MRDPLSPDLFFSPTGSQCVVPLPYFFVIPDDTFGPRNFVFSVFVLFFVILTLLLVFGVLQKGDYSYMDKKTIRIG